MDSTLIIRVISMTKEAQPMSTERKTQPNLPETAAKTTAVLQTLQSRLNREAAPAEPADELGEQLQRYFAAANSDQPSPAVKVPTEIRNLVIDGVVDRILRSWGEPNGQIAAIKSEVVGQL